MVSRRLFAATIGVGLGSLLGLAATTGALVSHALNQSAGSITRREYIISRDAVYRYDLDLHNRNGLERVMLYQGNALVAELPVLEEEEDGSPVYSYRAREFTHYADRAIVTDEAGGSTELEICHRY